MVIVIYSNSQMEFDELSEPILKAPENLNRLWSVQK